MHGVCSVNRGTVEPERAVARAHRSQRFERGRGRRIPIPRVLDDQEAPRAEMDGRRGQQGADVRCVVRRVEQYQVEHRGDEAAKGGRQRGPPHRAAIGEAADRGVAADQCGRPRITIDEDDVGGAAAQRFQTDGAGAGAAVEHPRTLDSGTQDAEEGLPQAIGSRAQTVPARREQPASLARARDDPHVRPAAAPSPRRREPAAGAPRPQPRAPTLHRPTRSVPASRRRAGPTGRRRCPRAAPVPPRPARRP